MKKLLTFVLIAAMFVMSLSVFAGCVARKDTLKILNWAEYIDDSLLEDFEEFIADTENGRKIRVAKAYEEAETNEEMYTKIKTGQRDYDLICPSDYMVEKMIKDDLLIKLNQSMLPNVAKTSPYVKSLYDQFTDVKIEDYMVGYTWGTMGILYNPARVKEATGFNDAQVEELVSSWNALWAKNMDGSAVAGLNGKITLKNSERDNYFVGATYLYGDASKAYRTDEVSKVGDALRLQKTVAHSWEVDELRLDIIAPNKPVIMGLQWAGDAQYAIDCAAEEGIELRYSVPDEGSNVFFDGWVIPKFAKQNGDLAEKFINFMCDPENAMQNASEIGYTSVIADKAAITEFFADEEGYDEVDLSYFFGEAAGTTVLNVSQVCYPEKSVLDNCFVMKDFGTAYQRVMDMWNTVKN